MVIDIHVHCFPDEVANRSVKARAAKFSIEPAMNGTLEDLKKSMLKGGVDVCVMQPIALKPEQTIKMNRWADQFKDEQVMSFGTIHPDYHNRKHELKWLAQHGFKGIKFHADCQGYYADDPHMLKIYDEVLESGMIILLHAGVDRAFSEPFKCTPIRVRNILDTFPGAPIIAAHMGGFEYWDDAEKYLLGRDIYLDTAYSIHEMGEARAEYFIKAHGADKVLFATDAPWRDHDMDINLIKSLNLTPQEIQMILGDNAARLLGLTSKA